MAQLITPDYNQLVPNLSLFGTGFEQGTRISESMANREALKAEAQASGQLAGNRQRQADQEMGIAQGVADDNRRAAQNENDAYLQSIIDNKSAAEIAELDRENIELTTTSVNALGITDKTQRRLFLERKKAQYVENKRDTSNIDRALAQDDAELEKTLTMQADRGRKLSDRLNEMFPNAGTQETIKKTEKLGAEIEQLKMEMEAVDTPDPKQMFDMETKLNKTYTTRTADFTASKSDYQKMKDSAKEGTGAGDVALIFSFMKMLDPGSVVRESEFAIAQNSGGLLESLVVQYEKAKDGDRLSQPQRDNFLVLAKKYMSASSKHEVMVRGDLQNIVDDYKLNSKNVFGNAKQREDLSNAEDGGGTGETEQGAQPQTNNMQDVGIINIDANGNRARVYKDGSFEEL
jgi:hypothetical protein